MRTPAMDLLMPCAPDGGWEYLSDTARRAPYGVLVIRDGVIADINDRGLTYGGYADRSTVLGTGFANFAAPRYRATIENRFALRDSGATVPEEYVFMGLAADGRQIPMHVKITRVEHPPGPLTLVVFREQDSDDELPA